MTLNYPQIRQQRLDLLRRALATCLKPDLQSFVFEIGCGHGHFLTAYAAAFPEQVCIGVDRDSERLERALRRRDRAAATNLHFLRADADLFLEALPVNLAIADLFVLFPDPWPKLRHHKHRLIQPAFLSSVASRLVPAGRLMFRTDHTGYYTEARGTVETHPEWTVVEEPWPFEADTIFQQRAPSHHSFIGRRRAGR